MSARRRTPERTVVLSLGSNLGPREEHILAGVSRLEGAGGLRLEALSSLYETSPVGIATSRAFINAILIVGTALPAKDLLAVCREAERAAGRTADGPSRDRQLDVDIVFCGDEVIDERDLAIPHPRFHERLFVLVPLAEIRPAFRVPPSGKAIADYLRSCGGDAWARKVSGRSWIR
ncbi:MAG: 2-amino-4-hydroxy-6-hydroxymethyldihydropteridine diphosphokinase [Candidatus Krumholzibacteria bacterium]|nr:2-amino-4-hydroxy-6-hydroxymethyldihydropteridine diphosphokinase [Candidatus Krumholzibacteria bacterium]